MNQKFAVRRTFIGNRSTAVQIFLKCPLKEIRGQNPIFAKFSDTATQFCDVIS